MQPPKCLGASALAVAWILTQIAGDDNSTGCNIHTMTFGLVLWAPDVDCSCFMQSDIVGLC